MVWEGRRHLKQKDGKNLKQFEKIVEIWDYREGTKSLSH